jgi:Carbohydrate binding domain
VDGSYSARVDITQSNATPWYLQLFQGGFSYTAGQSYTISFWSKASAQRNVNVVVQQGGGSYTERLNTNVTLSTSWQQYTIPFTPTASEAGLFSFNLAQASGQVWIDGVSLK